MNFPFISFLNLVLVTSIISGCGNMISNKISNPEPRETFVTISVTQTFPVNNDDAVPIQLIEKAKADLAERLGILEEEINVVEIRAVSWSDSSLGCPKQGILYTQVLTDGYLIIFDVNGTTYEYHTDTGERFFLCENLEFPVVPITPGEIDDGQPWMPN